MSVCRVGGLWAGGQPCARAMHARMHARRAWWWEDACVRACVRFSLFFLCVFFIVVCACVGVFCVCVGVCV